jgi:hypothetical protein
LKLKNKILFSFLLLLLIDCAFLKSVSVNPQPPDRSKKVQAEVTKFVILAFNFDNDFLDELPTKLSAQCPDGKISGIVTKYEDINYFLAYRMNVKSTGYCIKN